MELVSFICSLYSHLTTKGVGSVEVVSIILVGELGLGIPLMVDIFPLHFLFFSIFFFI